MSILLRRHIEQIITLTDGEFDYVLSHFKHRKFKKYQYLIQEGDQVPNDFFILNGLLKASRTDEQGKEFIVQFAVEDWWISDPQAYHNQTIATLNVVCLEDCETLSLSLQNREKLCAELHKMEHFFRKKTTAGYVALQRRILSLISTNAKQRYELFVQQYPKLVQRVPKTLIASYLGVTRETLSRLDSD